jgi:cbb3-type cytochrome oxidase subunit 1
MVASAVGIVASTQGLRLENLQQEGILLYHFVEGVFVLRTFGGEEDPQQ